MMISKERETQYIEEMRGFDIDFKNIPSKEQTHRLCLEAIKMDGENLEFVNEDFKTEELCLEAVKESGWAIEFIENPTEEMKLEAIKNYPDVMDYIKEPTEEMILFALREGLKIERFYDFNCYKSEEMERIIDVFSDYPLLIGANYREVRYLIKKDKIGVFENPFQFLPNLFTEIVELEKFLNYSALKYRDSCKPVPYETNLSRQTR